MSKSAEEWLGCPSGSYPSPPLPTDDKRLPLGRIPWPDFEIFCLRVAETTMALDDVRRYGVSGQDEEGIDVLAKLGDESLTAIQCKRYQSMQPNIIRKAVDEFVEGEWSGKVSRFVFATTASLERTTLVDEIALQRTRLQEVGGGVELEVWDEVTLTRVTRDAPDIVAEFFGSFWHQFLFPTSYASVPADLIERLATFSAGAPRVLVLSWASDRFRQYVERIDGTDRAAYVWLTEWLGEPPDPAKVRQAISTPSPRFLSDPAVWPMAARLAEVAGEWGAASQAWEQAAGVPGLEVYERVSRLISGKAAAGIDGDEASAKRLFDVAINLDPTHPRVIVESLDEEDSPIEQIDALRGVECRDDDDVLLVESKRALLSLLLPDIDAARSHLQIAKHAANGSTLVAAIEANVFVQQARLDVVALRAVNKFELNAAARTLLDLRQTMIRDRRWSESARLLMLAADCYCLQQDHVTARSLLRGAEIDELASDKGAIVLADCAVTRAFDYDLGRDFCAYAGSSSGRSRILAEIDLAQGSHREKLSALAVLDGLVAIRDRESGQAAFDRLMAAADIPGSSWSDDAEACLVNLDRVRMVTIAKALWREANHRFDEVDSLLAEVQGELWGKILKQRILLDRPRAGNDLKLVADQLSIESTSHHIRLETGRAFRKCREWDRAKSMLVQLARDASAPDEIRVRAYSSALGVVVGRFRDWQLGKELHAEVLDLRPQSEVANVWFPAMARIRV